MYLYCFQKWSCNINYNAVSLISTRCSCTFCADELLVGALEYRCCREVVCAMGKAVDGSIERIKCITEHEDYNPMVNEAVLNMVGPLLRSSDGRPYKRKTGQSKNELVVKSQGLLLLLNFSSIRCLSCSSFDSK